MIATLKIVLIRLVALGATAFSIGMIYWGFPLLHAVFRLTDPTGAFGATFVLIGFLANLCTVFTFGVFVRHGIISRSWRERMPVPFKLVFLLKAFEAVNILPCLGKQPGELCGVSSIFISYMFSPVVVAAAAQIIFRSADVKVRRAGQAMLVGVLIAGIIGWRVATPRSFKDCQLMHELTDRAVCSERFALAQRDIAICRTIDFRSVRYDCMERIAQAKREPALCEEIQTPPDARVSAFETPASNFRDLCYYGLAFSLHQNDLCAKVVDVKMHTTCTGQAGVSPRGPEADLPTGVEGANDGNGLPPR
ncbi:MAG TPA: hypothetical protein VL625_06960 [Patescibacteria group bacterium]|nr:hypothetical protein [Patescibacteria group bacterium]